MGPLSLTTAPIGAADKDDNDDLMHDDSENIGHVASSHSLPATAALSLDSDDLLLAPPISNIPSLVCAFCASATTGGTSYAFGLYAAALKHKLNLTQSQLNSISTAFFVAGLFTWIPGLFSDRYGTKFALSLGGCTGAASLLLYWCVAQGVVIIPPDSLVLVLSSLGVVTFLSCGSVTGAVFKIIVAATGPGTKGNAVGAAKGLVGLGAGLYSTLFNALRSPGSSDLDFLPMAAFFFIACATIPALVLLPSKRQLELSVYQDEFTSRHMLTLYGSLISMAVLIIVNSLLNLYQADATAHHHVGFAGEGGAANVPLDHASAAATSSGTQQASNYGMGLILIATWLGPIGVLQYLPRKRQTYTDGIINTRRRTLTDGEAPDERNDLDRSIRRRKSGPRDASSSTKSSDAAVAKVAASAAIAIAQPSPVRARAAGGLTRNVPSKSDKSSTLEEKRGLLVVQVGGDHAPESLLEEHGSGDVSSRHEAKGLRHTMDSNTAPAIDAEQQQQQQPSLNMLQMLQTPTAWLMLWTTTILVGAGTVETNGMGQMVESLGFDAKVTAASLAFFSVSQAAARVLTGSISESALNWNTRLFNCVDGTGVPRPFFLLVASLVGCWAHFMLGFARTEVAFVLGATLAGAAFGMVWPLMVLISAEVFGVAGAGQNYMFFDGVSSAAGTFLLTKIIAQEVYDYHTAHSSESGSSSSSNNNNNSNRDAENTCLGMACYQATHLIVAGLSLTCVLSSAAMLYTSRHVYSHNRTSQRHA